MITEKDKKAVMEMMDYGVSSADTPQINALEEEWAKYVGVQYCLLTNSGTSALHMAIAVAGIGTGDEVITVAYTFLASASCIGRRIKI